MAPYAHGDLIPRLAPFIRLQTDRITNKPILLVPEAVLNLTENGAEILRLCDGSKLSEIARRLAESYDAPMAEIMDDVWGFLDRLAEKGYVSWQEAE
jgi:pyrroloquinoline quinone biosynthesis protein D